MRVSRALEGGMNSMSPSPRGARRRRSRIIRESIRDVTWKEMRAGVG
jgi:hypothetical protein